MKALVILAGGLVACTSGASGEAFPGPIADVADSSLADEAGPLPSVGGRPVTDLADGGAPMALADGPVTAQADGLVTNVADGPPDVVADGPPAVRDGPPAVRDGPPAGSLTNVALEGTATASAVWENNPSVQPDNVIDNSAYDDSVARNFWLLPNETAGWWQVDLGADFKIRTIKVFNCNNDWANDRGTKDFRLEIRDATQDVTHTASGILPFTSFSSATSPTVPRVLEFEKPVRGRYVKIYVDSWYPTRTDPFWPHPTVDSSDPNNQGGGLNEVQVFAAE